MMPINYSHPGMRQSQALNIFQSWRATRFNSRAAVRLTVEGLGGGGAGGEGGRGYSRATSLLN